MGDRKERCPIQMMIVSSGEKKERGKERDAKNVFAWKSSTRRTGRKSGAESRRRRRRRAKKKKANSKRDQVNKWEMKSKRKQNQKFSEIKINANPTTQTRGELGSKKGGN